MGQFTRISFNQELWVILFIILYLQLSADRLFVEINVDTIYRCFLADAPRRTRHCPVVWLVRVQKAQERQHYGNAFSSCGEGLLFVCRSRTEWGWGNWQETQSRRPTTYKASWSGRLLCSSLCGFPWPYLGVGRFLVSLADAPQRIRLVGQVVCLVRVQRNDRSNNLFSDD